MSGQNISKQALKRIPVYLQFLKEQKKNGSTIISAPTAAAELKLNEVQVRKDFSAMSTTRGKPKTGFIVDELIENMESMAGYNNANDAILVGVGSLGRALMTYRGFDEYGLNIVAGFDADEKLIGTEVAGKKVYAPSKMKEICKKHNIRIGIITVPAHSAQEVCNLLVDAGILAIWNFAQAHLNVPSGILVQNENMAASLALLSKHLREHMYTLGEIDKTKKGERKQKK